MLLYTDDYQNSIYHGIYFSISLAIGNGDVAESNSLQISANSDSSTLTSNEA